MSDSDCKKEGTKVTTAGDKECETRTPRTNML